MNPLLDNPQMSIRGVGPYNSDVGFSSATQFVFIVAKEVRTGLQNSTNNKSTDSAILFPICALVAMERNISHAVQVGLNAKEVEEWERQFLERPDNASSIVTLTEIKTWFRALRTHTSRSKKTLPIFPGPPTKVCMQRVLNGVSELLQYQWEGLQELKAAKKTFGEVLFWGNISSMRILADLSPDAFRACKLKEDLETWRSRFLESYAYAEKKIPVKYRAGLLELAEGDFQHLQDILVNA